MTGVGGLPRGVYTEHCECARNDKILLFEKLAMAIQFAEV